LRYTWRAYSLAAGLPMIAALSMTQYCSPSVPVAWMAASPCKFAE